MTVVCMVINDYAKIFPGGLPNEKQRSKPPRIINEAW